MKVKTAFSVPLLRNILTENFEIIEIGHSSAPKPTTTTFLIHNAEAPSKPSLPKSGGISGMGAPAAAKHMENPMATEKYCTWFFVSSNTTDPYFCKKITKLTNDSVRMMVSK